VKKLRKKREKENEKLMKFLKKIEEGE